MNFVEYLVEKASGVFLWVELACQSILEGLDEYDTIPELMDRAMKTPPELGELFRHLIAGIGLPKRVESAKFLRLIFESQTSPAFDPVPTLGLAIVNEQGLRADFMGPSVTGLSNEEKVLLCKSLEGRLRSTCSGLVELQEDSAARIARENMTTEDAALVNSHVVFMHKSLYEFLCTEGIWEWDVLRTNEEHGRFEPHAILGSLWTQLAVLDHRYWPNTPVVAKYYNNALAHNIRASATKCSPKTLATNLSRIQGLFTVSERYSLIRDRAALWLPHGPECRKGCEDFSAGLAIAAELGMVSLVQLALEDPDEIRPMLILPQALLLRDCGGLGSCQTLLYGLNRHLRGSTDGTTSTVFPLLYYATCQPLLSLLRDKAKGVYKLSTWTMMSTEVVQYLLAKGHDPNERFYEHWTGTIATPWRKWLAFIDDDDNRVFPSERNIYHSCWNTTDSGCGIDLYAELAYQQATVTMLLVDGGAELGTPGTDVYDLVDKSLSKYTWDAAKCSGCISLEWARSNDVWLRVRDKVLSSRAVRPHQHEPSTRIM